MANAEQSSTGSSTRIAELEQALAEARGQALSRGSAGDWMAGRDHVLNAAQRAANVGWWFQDRETQRVHWSQGLYRICGVDPSVAPTVDSYYSLVHPDDLDEVLALAKKAHEKEPSELREFRICRASDGAIRYVQVDNKTSYSDDGSILGVLGTNLDVTDRRERERQLEGELRRAQRGSGRRACGQLDVESRLGGSARVR